MKINSDQEAFWANRYANDYIAKNSNFDHELGRHAWRLMLSKATAINSYLECGSNIGRNIEQLSGVLPDAAPSIIEISEPAFRHVTSHYALSNAFHGAILDSSFDDQSFDLVFTIGVLIHINPEHLHAHMEKMFRYSRRYILIGEYFNRTPIAIEYQGENDKLFKRDFGKYFLEGFSVSLVDYGFLWGHIYDKAGFDDITWWLFDRGDVQNGD